MNYEKLTKEIDKYAAEQLELRDLPSLAISCGFYSPDKGKDIYSYQKVIGWKDFVQKIPASADNVFHVASVTKTFTGVAIMQLVQAGQLSLQDKITDILPDFKTGIANKRYDEVTLEMLLSHTSGLGDVEDYRWYEPRTDKNALADYVYSDEVKNTALVYEPGDWNFAYSNIAYETLGEVIQKITGMSYETYIKRNLLIPAGMPDSTLLTFERLEKALLASNKTLHAPADCQNDFGISDVLAMNLNMVRMTELTMPHCKDEENRIVLCPHFPYNREHGPSSTVTTNIEDIANWGRTIIDTAAGKRQDILSADTLNEMWQPRTEVPNNREKVGLTWFIRKQAGHTFYGHEGTDDGFRASFWVCPNLDADNLPPSMYVAVMTNISGGPTKKILKGLTEILLDTNT